MGDIENNERPDNSNYWKFGIFYFNAQDSRVFVPKRLKMLGWTLNFANWKSWLVILIFCALLFFLNTIK